MGLRMCRTILGLCPCFLYFVEMFVTLQTLPLKSIDPEDREELLQLWLKMKTLGEVRNSFVQFLYQLGPKEPLKFV